MADDNVVPISKAQDPMTDASVGFGAPLLDYGMNFKDQGSYGLRQWSGWIREEPLPDLVGREGVRAYREMLDNNSTVGAMLFAIIQAMRGVDWRIDSADKTNGEGDEWTDFVESLMDDMSHTWPDFVAEALTMLPYGYSAHEIVYKRRNGRNPTRKFVAPAYLTPNMPRPQPDAGPPGSRYDDGRIGWRRLPIRGQDTIIKWFLNSNGQVTGLTQQPWSGVMIDIPIEKLLLFRPTVHKNNPEGRACDPDTPIPTPDGWRKLDDIHVGDKVFDEQGCIRYVTARADWNDRPCHRLTFSDGFEIVADDAHEWLIQNQYERNHRFAGKLRITAEIAGQVKTPAGVSNYSIPWAGALDYPEQVLLFPPYLLGMWLGDGTSRTATISCHADDLQETLVLVEAEGFEVKVTHNGVAGGSGRSLRFYGQEKWASDGPVHLLRAIGVLGNKHIPQAYLRGSISQRMALLSGLMDSDGHIDSCGRCEFSNTNASLAFGVAELVRSLGIGAALSNKINSHGHQAWLVKFTPTWVPFRLSRKAARCRTERQRMQHYIVAAERVSPRRTVCIEVDSPSHLFLIGEGMVPTHNSVLRNCYRAHYFTKRLEEQEAILYERMGGIPVIYVPNALIAAAAGKGADAATAQQALQTYKKIATNVRIDEQMGLVLPSDPWMDVDGKVSNVRKFEFQLATPQHGRGQLNVGDVIERYKVDMLMTLLADFIHMGHEIRGTNNLAVTKVDMFYSAIEGWLDSISAVMNNYALPRLWKINGFDEKVMPKFKPTMPTRLDLDSLGAFIKNTASAGMPFFPDEELEAFVRDAAGMPDLEEGTSADAEAAAMAQRAAPMGRPGGGARGGGGGGVPNDTDSIKRMLMKAVYKQMLRMRRAA